MKIQNAFRLGLVATLGVGVGLLIWGAVGNLATILTYIGGALFIALGLDPMVKWLESRGFARWQAVLSVVVLVLGALTGIVFAIIPAVAEQATSYFDRAVIFFSPGGGVYDLVAYWRDILPEWLDIDSLTAQIVEFFQNPDNITGIGGGVLSVGIGIANGVFGALIVLILTLYFTVALKSVKEGMYQFVPASKRPRFIELSEQIGDSVGRYVMGQVTLALINAIISFIFLTIVRAPFPAVLAFIAFLFALIPLVGTLTGSAIIVLSTVLLGTDLIVPWFVVAIFYLVYMQIEAYVISPNIMKRAVSVPAPVVVVAALIGGTLLGILGALIAIPVAASILLIVREVVVPRQQQL